jgi:nitrogen fixation/metabolism regulation signal transduction histidine kinase
LIYPFTIIELFNRFTQNNPQAAEAMKVVRTELLIFLGIYQLLYIGIVFVLCIFLTHKIAGPMYKLTNYLRGITEGNTPGQITFRNGDNFAEVAEELNLAFDRLADQREEDYAYITEIISYVNNLSLVIPEDKRPVMDEINARLRDMQKRLHSDD